MMQGDAYYMMQGDARDIAIQIMNGDNPLTINDVNDLEVTIGALRKKASENEITFSDDMWLFHVTQEETFDLRPGYHEVQCRVVWPDGNVEGVELGRIRVLESESREVL